MALFDEKYEMVTYYINWQNRKETESSWDFTYTFNAIPNLCNAVFVSQLQIPKSYYLINEYNNVFWAEYDDTFFKIELIKGEYNEAQFLEEVARAWAVSFDGYNNNIFISANGEEWDDTKILRKKPEYNFSGAMSSTTFIFWTEKEPATNETYYNNKSNLHTL